MACSKRPGLTSGGTTSDGSAAVDIKSSLFHFRLVALTKIPSLVMDAKACFIFLKNSFRFANPNRSAAASDCSSTVI